MNQLGSCFPLGTYIVLEDWCAVAEQIVFTSQVVSAVAVSAVCMNQAKGASKASSSFAVNPELVCIIKNNSPLPAKEPVSKHIEAIQCRRAKEVAVFLRACSLRF